MQAVTADHGEERRQERAALRTEALRHQLGEVVRLQHQKGDAQEARDQERNLRPKQVAHAASHRRHAAREARQQQTSGFDRNVGRFEKLVSGGTVGDRGLEHRMRRKQARKQNDVAEQEKPEAVGDDHGLRGRPAGADLTCIVIISMVREAGKDRMFNLQTDLEMLRRKIDEVGDVVLVLIDPSAYLGVGRMDSYRTTDVRAVLGPVVSLAAELKLSVIGIMHFNKKLDVTNALLRISDSLAYGATARHVYGVINDAENKRKLMVRAKNNLAVNTAEQTTLVFYFGTREVGTDPNNDRTIVAPYLIWEAQYVDVAATEAMQAANESKAPTDRQDTKQFVLDIVAGGPVKITEIEETATANGISIRTLKRAKRELKNVVARAVKDEKGAVDHWVWELLPEE